jgi:hypothetical protein
MHRWLAIPLLLTLQSTQAQPQNQATTPSTSSSSSTSSANTSPASDETVLKGPLRVDYKVTGAKPDVILLSGQMQATPFSTSGFEQHLNQSFERLKMTMTPKPQRDGTVAVELEWEEGTAAGRLTKVELSLQGKRGEPLTGTVNWPGDSRTATLVVH